MDVACDQYARTADFFDAAARAIFGCCSRSDTRVLDLGTGSGHLVDRLVSLGYDARGCDINPYWEEAGTANTKRLSLIQTAPYRLPYDDSVFDIVFSNSVLEHAQNKPEVFREIHRVLKPGGGSLHLFPSRWYLPTEPHLYVPLANFFSPSCPRWWLALWAILGVRNEYQQGKPWRAVVELNARYFREGLSYWARAEYQRESLKVFGNFSTPMGIYVANAHGGAARLLRKLRIPGLAGWLIATFREVLIVQRKA